MSGKKDTKRSTAARRGWRKRAGGAGALGKVAMALASHKVTTYARLVTLQRMRLEAQPPTGESLSFWMAEYDWLWTKHPNLCDDDAIWPVDVCKQLAEGPLQHLHDYAAAMGATVSVIDKARVERSGNGWRSAA